MNMELHSWLNYGGCWLLVAAVVILVRLCGRLYLGFSVFTVLNIAIMNVSAFFIAKTFGLQPVAEGPEYQVVYTYTIAGLLAFVFGVYLAWRPGLHQAAENPFSRYKRLVPVIGVIGGVMMLFGALLPRVPSVSAVLHQLVRFVPLAAVGAASRAMSRNDYHSLLFVAFIFFPVGMLSVVMTGFSGIMGATMLHPFLIVLFYRGVSLWRVVAFGIVLYAFFFLAGLWFETRWMIREGTLNDRAPVAKSIEYYGFLVQTMRNTGLGPRVIQAAAVHRVDLSGFNAAQVLWMPEGEPYSYGRSLIVDPVLALVPRLLWPGKPFVSGDSEFINRYTGLSFSNDSTSVDTNITFEFYANFGWPGVVVGLGFFGYLMGRLELLLFRPGNSIVRIFVLSIVLLSLSRGGRRAAALALEVGSAVIAAYLFAKLAERFDWLRQRGGKKPLINGPRSALGRRPE